MKEMALILVEFLPISVIPISFLLPFQLSTNNGLLSIRTHPFNVSISTCLSIAMYSAQELPKLPSLWL